MRKARQAAREPACQSQGGRLGEVTLERRRGLQLCASSGRQRVGLGARARGTAQAGWQRRPGGLANQVPTFPARLSVFPAGALRVPVATAPAIAKAKVEIIKINLLLGCAMHAMQLEYLVIFQVAAKKHTHSRISGRICGAITQKNRLIARNAPICPGRRPRSSSVVPSSAGVFFAPGGPRLPRTIRGGGANTRVRWNNLATPCSTD